MTRHIRNDWTFDQPISSTLVTEIAQAIRYHGYQRPAAYAILSHADQMIYAIGGMLEKGCGQILSQDWIEEFVPSETTNRDNILLTIKLILQELQLFDKPFTT